MEQEATSLSGNNSNTERSLNQEIKFQFEMHEARFQQASASLEKGFLQEVLSRLQQAAAQTANQHNSHLDYLAVGQQNEMNNYRHKIRMMELESEFAQCRMDVLNAQGQSGNLLAVRLDNEPNQSIDFAAGLTSASLINVLTVPAKKSKALPSALFSSSFDPFPFNFKSHNELFRPVSLTKRTPVYFSRSLSPKFSTRSLIPSSSQRRTFGSTRSRTRNYSYGIPSYKSHPTYGQAYRYGAVRSDLRPHLRVGQIPWQLPGSTPSFGTSQLQNNSRFTSFGATGNALYPTYSSSRYGW